MDIIKYFQTALKLWIFDEKAIQEVKENEYPILIGALLIFVIGLVTSSLTILQEIITQPPVEESMLAYLGFSLSYSSLVLVIPIALLSLTLYLVFFVWSHLWIKIFGGKLALKKTLEIFLLILCVNLFIGILSSVLTFMIMIFIVNQFLSIILTLILGFIMFGIFVWGLVVVVNTISKVHDMDFGKTIGAGLLAVGIPIAIIIVVTIFIFLAFLGSGGGVYAM